VVPDTFEVVELRRYALRPQQRDTLIALFERELVETQEACGMAPFGHFRDLDDPDAFVWLRGFPVFEKRSDALAAFYGSPCWAAHREAANATMIDSDNVLLLRDARAGSGFDLRGLERPSLDRDESPPKSVVAATVFMLERAASEEILAAFEQTLLPALAACAERVAYLVTDERPNAFPRLPVREGEFALVAAGVCSTPAAVNAWRDSLEEPRLPQVLRSALKGIETLRLQPARRSRFR
jgi:NIPSNAP